MGLFGLEEIYDKLPPLRYAADICGYVTKEAARQTNLPAGIPVAAGMFDVDACGIASGLCDEEQMCMVAGTWSINEFIRREPVTNGSVALNSMFCIPGYFLVEESSPTSAGNMEWFITNLMSHEKEECRTAVSYTHLDVYKRQKLLRDVRHTALSTFLQGWASSKRLKNPLCGGCRRGAVDPAGRAGLHRAGTIFYAPPVQIRCVGLNSSLQP